MKKYLFMAMGLYLATECYAAAEEALVNHNFGPGRFIRTNAPNVDPLPDGTLVVAGDNITIAGAQVGSIRVVATQGIHLRPQPE